MTIYAFLAKRFVVDKGGLLHLKSEGPWPVESETCHSRDLKYKTTNHKNNSGFCQPTNDDLFVYTRLEELPASGESSWSCRVLSTLSQRACDHWNLKPLYSHARDRTWKKSETTTSFKPKIIVVAITLTTNCPWFSYSCHSFLAKRFVVDKGGLLHDLKSEGPWPGEIWNLPFPWLEI